MRIVLVLVAAALCIPRPAAAQAQPPAIPDSVRAGISQRTLDAKYVGGIKGDVNSISMGNRFSLSAGLGSGVTSLTTLSVDDSEGRIEERSITNKSFISSLVYSMAPGFVLNGGVSDTRSFNRLITSTGLEQDFINNVQRADASGSYSRALGMGVSMMGNGAVSAGRSEQTFENNQSEDGAGALGLRYGLGSKFDASARGFIRGFTQESESGGRKFSGLGGAEDSVLARARLIVTDSSMVRVEYVRHTSNRDYLDIPRTSQGGLAISDTTQVIPERETKDNRSVSISAETAPFPGLTLKLRAEHSDAATYFIKAQERIGRDTGDQVSGNLTYSPSTKTSFTFDFDNRKTFRWLGPQRTGHYDDKGKKLGFGWNQTITATLRLTAQAGASLAQTFYIDPDQDGDRDQKYVYANVRLSSKLFPKVDAAVYVNVARTDYVLVRASRSANNRQETIYELRPEYTYKINDRVELKQKYGLNIQFADYVFQEDENFLDRILSFSNELRTRLSGRLGVDFYYTLQLHDKGSYLRPEPGAERVLVVNQEERRDELKVSFRYQINKHLALTGANDYSRRKDLMSQSSTGVFKNGGVEIGIAGNYDLGPQRTLKVAMKRVKRFGRFNTAAQNDYWVMDSSINYTF